MAKQTLIQTKRKSKIEIKIGDKFGRLLILKKEKRKHHWLCKCDCGNKTIVYGGHLRAGTTKSCGCLKKELSKKRMQQQATTHGMYKASEYKTWVSMLQRCNNSKHVAYKYYGGRGIIVCPEWANSFIIFFKDMGPKPKGLTLERIDNKGNYEPNNCEWASRIVQSRNQRLRKDNKTGINGIAWYERRQKYRVRITANHTEHWIGYFATLEQAKIARQEAEQKYWRE